MNVIERFKVWRERRYWEKRHMDFLRMMIASDLRWLSVDPRGQILLERYEKMVSSDWYRHPFEDIDSLRKRLGWCPHDKAKNEKHGD